MLRTSGSSPRYMIASAFVAFAAFGAFWGVWGASVPLVQQQAGVSDGQLGLALLFVGGGALPAMLLTGRALDRWGLRVAAVVISALGVVGAGLALTAVNLASLCIGLALVGATSGAADVAENAVAGRAEKIAGQPVITRTHGVFSSLVVLGSLATGLAWASSLPLAVPFTAVAVLSLMAGALLLKTLPTGVSTEEHGRIPPGDSAPFGRRRIVPCLLIGILGALAFASESAHQNWSAVFAHNELHAAVGLSAIAPAVFAGTVAITRFATGGLKAGHARTVLLVGGLTAAAGAVLLAAAPTLFVAGLGLVAAGAGTAVLFPTLIGIVSRTVDEYHRGRATSVVTTVSYLGFLLGPVYVGLWADAVGLRGAMVAVAALAVGLFVLTPALLRLSGLATQLATAPRISRTVGRFRTALGWLLDGRKPNSRRGNVPAADIVELIKNDHREVERLFDLLKKQPATRGLNYPVVCALLVAHSRAEESEVYPVAKNEAGETEEVAHSQDEHAEAEHMLEEMAEMDPESAEFDKALDELIEAVKHHVEEEESRVLPGMQERLSEARRAELAEAFLAARREHLGDRPGEATRADLEQQARNVGLSGASSSSKEELKEELLEHAQQSGE